jgi:type VI secretion system protein ImpG
MSVVEFYIDPQQGKLSTGFTIPQSSLLYSRPVDGVPCKFRTGYDTTLWPIRVTDAGWRTPERLDPPLKAPEALAACRIELACEADLRFANLDLRSLRFYLTGESNLIHTLYELLFNNCAQILVRDPDAPKKLPLRLPPTSLRPMGFRDDEALISYSRRSFTGYRVLQEYFAFPEKFFFVELSGLEELAATGFGTRAEVIFLITPFELPDRQQTLELGVTPKNFRLNCSPVINLFSHSAEPIHLDQTRHEYPVVPDARRKSALEIFSVDTVVSSNPRSQEIVHFDPAYTYRHRPDQETAGRAFWKASRRPSGRKNDNGTDVWISLEDESGRSARDGIETLTVHCTCSNRDLPARLPFGNESGDLEMEGVSVLKKIVVLRKPTGTLRPPTGRRQLWKLISHLSLNYLSLVEDGKEALQEILRLYNFSESTFLDRQISGITAIGSKRQFARVVSEQGINFARGTRVDLELDEEQFVGGGVYLFAAVLEYFLGHYVTMNSFSQLAVRTHQRKELLKVWPPRAGHQILM